MKFKKRQTQSVMIQVRTVFMGGWGGGGGFTGDSHEGIFRRVWKCSMLTWVVIQSKDV